MTTIASVIRLKTQFMTHEDGTNSTTNAMETTANKNNNSNNTTSSSLRPIRVVYGIMSHNLKDSEKGRRQQIRDTFLTFYHNSTNTSRIDGESDSKFWICALNDLDQGRLEEPEKCRFAYAFVIGANKNAPKSRLNYNDSNPLLGSLTVKSIDGTEEPDVVYLNIKENGDYGKTPTWFRYVTSVLKRKGWTDDWDFIFKTDSDNILFTPKFFHFLENNNIILRTERPIRNVYGGDAVTLARCGGKRDRHCRWLKKPGKYYMQGGSYFLSTDLAAFVSDPSNVNWPIISRFPHEDILTGRTVHLYPGLVRRMGEPMGPKGYRYHRVKKNEDFQRIWNEFVDDWEHGNRSFHVVNPLK
ncbi:hypothetical protein ACA910_004011 [Epithemia clementina (nom. ined.)]